VQVELPNIERIDCYGAGTDIIETLKECHNSALAYAARADCVREAEGNALGLSILFSLQSWRNEFDMRDLPSAVVVFAGTIRLNPVSTGTSGRDGYEKCTFEN
jgi:hypothetical protein